ncbi:hypothetical protein [Phormidesmis priestleyi]
MQITITLPPAIETKLLSHARHLNVSLESLVLKSLEETVAQISDLDNDPLIAFFGSIHSDTPDLAENHDFYLG